MGVLLHHCLNRMTNMLQIYKSSSNIAIPSEMKHPPLLSHVVQRLYYKSKNQPPTLEVRVLILTWYYYSALAFWPWLDTEVAG